MRFGVLTFVTDEGIGPVELGEALEERGFASVFLAEHSHIPVDAKTPYPSGGPIPHKYYRTLDPFVALTAAAVATRELVVGTGIALLRSRRWIWSPTGGFAWAWAWAGCAKRSPTMGWIPKCGDAWSRSVCAR